MIIGLKVTTIFKGEAEPGSEGGELPGTKPHSKVRSLDNVKLGQSVLLCEFCRCQCEMAMACKKLSV